MTFCVPGAYQEVFSLGGGLYVRRIAHVLNPDMKAGSLVDRVRIHGLVSASERGLNGLYGKITSYNEGACKFVVRLDGRTSVKSIPPHNLIFVRFNDDYMPGIDDTHGVCPGDPICVHSLVSVAGQTLNGRHGEVVCYIKETNRFCVQLAGVMGRKALSPANLAFVNYEECYDVVGGAGSEVLVCAVLQHIEDRRLIALGDLSRHIFGRYGVSIPSSLLSFNYPRLLKLCVQDSSAIHVMARNLAGTQIASLRLPSLSSAMDLKRALWEGWGVSMFRTKLVVGNGALAAASLLADHGHAFDVTIVNLPYDREPGADDIVRFAALGDHVNLLDMLTFPTDPNHCIATGETALLAAAAGGHASIVEMLVQADADVNNAMPDGTTPYSLAVENAHYGVARLIESYKCMDTVWKSTDAPTTGFDAASEQISEDEVCPQRRDGHPGQRARNLARPCARVPLVAWRREGNLRSRARSVAGPSDEKSTNLLTAWCKRRRP